MAKIELRLREAVSLGMTDYKLFQLAASCVQGSSRRIAAAIIRRSRYHNLPLLPAETKDCTNGYIAVINNQRVMVGSLSFMRKHDINMQYALGILRSFVSDGYIVRFVSVNAHLAGVLAFKEIYLQ